MASAFGLSTSWIPSWPGWKSRCSRPRGRRSERSQQRQGLPTAGCLPRHRPGETRIILLLSGTLAFGLLGATDRWAALLAKVPIKENFLIDCVQRTTARRDRIDT